MNWCGETIQGIPVKVAQHHGPGHLDDNGFCQCSRECCLASEGRCKCSACACAAIGKCEAHDGPCYKCGLDPHVPT